MIDRIFKYATIQYYSQFILGIIAALIGFNLVKNGYIIENETIKITIQNISYIYLCTTLPFALWYFNKQINKNRNETNELIKEKKYKQQVSLRLWLIGVGFIANIILFYSCQNNSFLYVAAIEAVGLIFCKPKKNTIKYELESLNENDEE